MSKPKSQKLPQDQYTEYNGQRVHWFIGDYNSSNQAWEAWGSCNGFAYQLFSLYRIETRTLIDISVLPDNGSGYFNQENYNLLTRE